MTPPIRFFSPDEAKLMEALSAHVVPQDDKDEAHRIPVVALLDERLHLERAGAPETHEAPVENDGAGAPSPAEAYRLGLRGVDAIAELLHDRSFVDLDAAAQAEVLKTLQGGDSPRCLDAWARVPAHRFWRMLVRDLLEAYYAHPRARDTLAPFPSPSSPPPSSSPSPFPSSARETAIAADEAPEPWEIEHPRCAWEAPLPSHPRGEAELRLAAWKRSG